MIVLVMIASLVVDGASLNLLPILPSLDFLAILSSPYHIIR